jgi:hypothetical protein
VMGECERATEIGFEEGGAVDDAAGAFQKKSGDCLYNDAEIEADKRKLEAQMRRRGGRQTNRPTLPPCAARLLVSTEAPRAAIRRSVRSRDNGNEADGTGCVLCASGRCADITCFVLRISENKVRCRAINQACLPFESTFSKCCCVHGYNIYWPAALLSFPSSPLGRTEQLQQRLSRFHKQSSEHD